MIDAGDSIPNTAMITPDGGTVSAGDYAGTAWVLYFYPRDDTPGCTKQAIGFSELKDQFDAIGVPVLGVSADPPKKHEKFIAKHDLTVALATDEDSKLSEELGVWKEKKMYGKTYMGMERTTFLIGKDGKIACVWRKVKVPGHVEEVLEAAKAL